MHLRIASLLVGLALLGGLAACGGSGVTGDFGVEEVPFDVEHATAGYIPTLDGPLRAIAVTPFGGTTAMLPRQPVTVTFSRPMVALGEAPTPDAGWFTIRPSVDGEIGWDGSQTLVFTPNEPWPTATEFRVRVAAGIPSLDGEERTEAIEWRFETPRPMLVRSNPAEGERFADPSRPIYVDFNQAIDQRRVEQFVELRTAAGQLMAKSTAADGDSSIVVTPREPLQAGTEFELVLQAGLPPARGNLPMAEDTVITFTTYGPPDLTLVDQPIPDWERPDDGRFDPERGVRLTFSTPVDFAEVRRTFSTSPATSLQPGAEARDGRVSTTHVLPVILEPETSYTFGLGPIVDAFGQRLVSAEGSFRTQALAPNLSMPQGILVIEAAESPVIPVRATNVQTARLAVNELSIEEVIPLLRTYDRDHWYGTLEEGEALPATHGLSESLDIPLPRNRPGVVPLDLGPHLQRGAGIAVVRLARPDVNAEQNDLRAVVQVTDLNVTAKFSPHRKLVFVTRLRDGQPVGGASVSIRDEDNREVWRGTTDERGRAESPGWDGLGISKPDQWSSPHQYVFVEHEGDTAFTASLYNDGVEPWRFNLNYDWNPQPRRFAGTVFSDRGLYRTGERVHLKGLLRTRTDGEWQSVHGETRVVIIDPRSEVVFDREMRTSEMGSLDLEWTPPGEAAQGIYQVRIAATDDTTAVDSWSPSAWAEGSFRVDAFRSATFEVNAQPSAPAYVAGDYFEGVIEARYLFGAPMGNQPVRTRLYQLNTQYSPPGFEAFRFGSLDWRHRHDELMSADTLLSPEGTLQRRIRLEGTETGSPLELVWEATVTDPARQTQTGVRRVVLHPGLFYVGLRPRTTYLDIRRDGSMGVDVVTVDPAGAPVGGRDVEIELVRQQWNSVREVGADGRLRWRSERTEEVLGRRQVTTAQGRMSRLSLPVSEGGSYIIRATARDVRGNVIRSEAHFWASGEGYVAWERSDDDRIDLIPEQTSYAPGETARLMVQSPYESATALVTVEREGILSSRVVTLEGSAPQVEVELTEEHLPNVFVSVVLLHGRSARPEAASDPGAPSYKMGYANLQVDPGVRRLTVEVDPDQGQYRPGDTVTVDLRLTDHRGRGVPGEITFSAADAAVLNLLNYNLPDPFETFYGPRPLAVTTSVTVANLVRQRGYGTKEEDLGGGGGDRSDMLRRDFRPLAHWAPTIRTDGSGRARISFELPESLTTFRLMAAAHTATHRFGRGTAEIIVQQPLVLQAALPRFARTGDSFQAGVLVTNLTGAPGEAVITSEASTGVTRVGRGDQRVTLAAGETREVRFNWRADATGEPELRFTARLGDERDAFATTLPVAVPMTRTRSGTFASTEGHAAEAIVIPEDAEPGLGGIRVTLASTALAGLDGAARFLFETPLASIEHQTSRVRPLLVGHDVLEAFDLDGMEDRDEVVRNWLASLDAFWTGEGFSMWRGQRWTNPYVSAYVVLALAEARDAGYDVPERLTADAVAWLGRTVRNRSQRPAMYDAATWDASRALMLYALARHDQVLHAEINEMAGRAGELSPEALAHLLRTVSRADGTPVAVHRETLQQHLRPHVRVEATGAYVQLPDPGMWGWIFASNVRTTALTLAALVEADPGADNRMLAERMIRHLMGQQVEAAWPSSQDNAAVMDAFRVFVDTFERDTPAFTAEVQLAGRTLLRESFAGRSLDVASEERSLDGLPRGSEIPATFDVEGSGRLYYHLAIDSYSTSPKEARSRGLQVSRTIQPLDDRGETVGPALTGRQVELEAGQLVRVTLRVTSPTSRHYVAVEDGLPAGLEALNTAFETTETFDHREDQSRWWGSFNHTEIHDDRVLLFADFLNSGEHTYSYLARATTPGAFTHPPLQAEEIYNPEVSGRTASGRLVVTSR